MTQRLAMPLVGGLVLSVLCAAALPLCRTANDPGLSLDRMARGYEEAPRRAPLRALYLVPALCALGVGLLAAMACARAAERPTRKLASQVLRAVDFEPIPVEDLEIAEVAEAAARVRAFVGRARELETAAALAREREAAEWNARTHYLASRSHELRSPLNSILGFSELLLRGLDGELGAEDRSALADIHRAGRRLLGLLHEILDTARCDAGKMTVEAQPVMPAELLRQAIEELRRVELEPHEARVHTELQPGMPSVIADPIRLPQAIAHLVTHALATAPPGAPLKLTLGDENVDGQRNFIVAVEHEGKAIGRDWDTGPLVVHRLSPGNLGLALPLARRLAELHGGGLRVEESLSYDGPHARFSLVVPSGPRKLRIGVLRPRAAPAAQPAATAPGPTDASAPLPPKPEPS